MIIAKYFLSQIRRNYEFWRIHREIKVSARILFIFAIISFINSGLVGDFTFTKVFVVGFMIDFLIRLFVNPKFAPSLIIVKVFPRN